SGAAMTANLEVENAPIFLFEDFAIDEVTGNGDGDIDPGEQWDMPVTLYNRGLGANNVTGDLSTSEVRVSIQNGNTSFGTVAAESEATGAPPFRATLQAGAQLDAIPFTLGIHYGLGQLVQVPFLVGVNDPLEMYRWTHENVSTGYGDQWHLSGQRNHTPGGAFAWKCGDTGNDVYANLLDAALVTRPLPLATVDAVRFWHWIDAEDDANFTAWDGGIVEASIDGGAWFQITPDGGYPYTIIANPASPFPGDTPCYSGSHDWSEARFDLTGLNGNSVRLRFRFGSDGYVTYEGWYIDDVVIEGSIAGAEDALASGAALQLSPARPNPASGPLTLSFVQPAGVSAHAALVDATGRRLATWDFPASAATATQRIAWDGRLANGERAASGVYFFRLEAGSARSSQRVLWIR
ncbi:MAG: immune inhibitor A, partial [Candidatus Eisenbacteria bacterium]|nr:immune inhibitor A [Candidatus Eisenbacteria bacterium]